MNDEKIKYMLNRLDQLTIAVNTTGQMVQDMSKTLNRLCDREREMQAEMDNENLKHEELIFIIRKFIEEEDY